jgi:hypothetical protein
VKIVERAETRGCVIRPIELMEDAKSRSVLRTVVDWTPAVSVSILPRPYCWRIEADDVMKIVKWLIEKGYDVVSHVCCC